MSRSDGLRKALFLDRDGIINEDTGYPHKPQHIIFRDEVFSLCSTAVRKGYLIVVVSNQSGVARGMFTEQDVDRLHGWMAQQFLSKGIPIAAFYYCPHHIDAVVERYRKDCEDRKPRPGMFLRAAQDLGIDLAASLMVGDKPSDRIQLPRLRSLVVKSNYTGDDFDVESISDVKRFL